MEEKLRVWIGILNDVVVNKELGLIIEEQRPNPKNLWWRQLWPSLKPFVNGGATGFLTGFTLYVPLAALYYSPMAAPFRNNPKYLRHHILIKTFPGAIFIHALTTTQQLGLFEILRNKVIATNDGMPPILYQEAACGLTAGAAGACISFPFYLAYLHTQVNSIPPATQHWKYRNIFHAFYHITANKKFPALWSSAGPYVKRRMGLDVGMLASYNPSLHYLRESCGFSETRAQLGASAISGFFAAACSLPVQHVLAHMDSGYASSLDCALKILKSRGPLVFFTGFSRYFVHITPPIMCTWFVFETIRKLELSIGL